MLLGGRDIALGNCSANLTEFDCYHDLRTHATTAPKRLTCQNRGRDGFGRQCLALLPCPREEVTNTTAVRIGRTPRPNQLHLDGIRIGDQVCTRVSAVPKFGAMKRGREGSVKKSRSKRSTRCVLSQSRRTPGFR